MDSAVKNKILAFYDAHKMGIDELANYIGVPPIWLVCLFYQESGLNPKSVNKIGASGLNQLMPDTAKGLGIDLVRYRTGDVQYQLDSMRKFFKPIRNKVKTAGDLYMYNFYPASVSKNYAMDEIIGQKGNYSKAPDSTALKHYIYSQNVGLDYNSDNKITRSDIADLFNKKYDELVKQEKKEEVIREIKADIVTPVHSYRYFQYGIVGVATLIIAYYTYKHFKTNK